jgi:CRP-like cAMP-binding protein
MLFWQGEPVKQVFILCAGLVRLFFHTPEGEELTWKHTRPGQIMGYTGARGDQSLTLSAQVVDDSLVRVIALADFRRWLHAESEFRDRIDQIVAEELHQVHLQLRELGCKVSTEKRVARLLLRLTSGQSNERMIRATVEQLGQMVGLKHRAMTKHLGEFNREREISSRVV